MCNRCCDCMELNKKEGVERRLQNGDESKHKTLFL